MNNAEMNMTVVTDQTTGEMKISLEVPGQVAVLLTADVAGVMIRGLTKGIEYINANQQLKAVPDNVVQLKH